MEKITFAIPVSGGKLCAHFGHCDQFAILQTENGKIIDEPTNKRIHSGLYGQRQG